MYKCVDCGHIFDEGEQLVIKDDHGMGGGFYETFSVCPVCGGGYDQTENCHVCGGEHLEEELFDGICEECLAQAIDYDNVFCYLTETNRLEHFMFEAYFGSPIPKSCSAKLSKTLAEWFLRQRNDDLLRDKTDFLDICKKYILEDDGDYGKQDFAEWLKRKEVPG